MGLADPQDGANPNSAALAAIAFMNIFIATPKQLVSLHERDSSAEPLTGYLSALPLLTFCSIPTSYTKGPGALD
jgi:hypothetical protein